MQKSPIKQTIFCKRDKIITVENTVEMYPLCTRNCVISCTMDTVSDTVSVLYALYMIWWSTCKVDTVPDMVSVLYALYMLWCSTRYDTASMVHDMIQYNGYSKMHFCNIIEGSSEWMYIGLFWVNIGLFWVNRLISGLFAFLAKLPLAKVGS